jgi:enoyl-[acyl-carrier protein] reductase I
MTIPVFPETKVALKGRKGLIVGIANDQSIGSQMVVQNYNVMGVAKAAPEAAVRYIAAELGPEGIRVHAISPGPLATRAASDIPEFDELMDKAQAKAPARRLVSIDDVGAATAFLALAGAKLITGGVMYIDGGYHIID